MTIRLTSSAIERVRGFLAKDASAVGFRFGVKRTGCSGWGYVVAVAHSRLADDAVFEQEGVAILVDASSLPLVDGTEIDFQRHGLNQQFVFNNPQAAAACGCGESFTTA